MGARNRVGIGLPYRPARLHRRAESIPGLLERYFMLPCIIQSIYKTYWSIIHMLHYNLWKIYILKTGQDTLELAYNTQSTHRVATVAFWRTFHHDGKISLVWWGWGVHAHPPFTIFTITYKVAVYAPAERGDTIHHPYFISILMYSVSLHLRYVPICSGF